MWTDRSTLYIRLGEGKKLIKNNSMFPSQTWSCVYVYRCMERGELQEQEYDYFVQVPTGV